MCWMIGVKTIQGEKPFHIDKLLIIAGEKPLFRVDNPDLMVLAGGLNEMCTSSLISADTIQESSSTGWIVCGIGICNSQDGMKIADYDFWSNSLLSTPPDIPLDGHFVFLSWKNGRLTIQTDKIGAQKIYYFEENGNVYFSTAIAMLSKLHSSNTLDISAIASSWNLQCDYQAGASAIKGINKPGPGTIIDIDNKKVNITSSFWVPSQNSTDEDTVEKMFIEVIRLPEKSNRKILLNLSGGMDSRTMLALLTKGTLDNCRFLVFGNNDHPDVVVAKEVAKQAGIKLVHTKADFGTVQSDWQKLNTMVFKSGILYPPELFIFTENFEELNNQQCTMIDGVAGELIRKRTGNRLRHLLGSRYISNNPELIGKRLASSRPDIFEDSISKLIKDESLKNIQSAISAMPPEEKIGNDKWVDILIMRYAFWGDSPEYTDSKITNYMPFSLPTFLDMIYNLDNKKKKDNRFCRKVIRKYCPDLEKVRVVRALCYAPYYTTGSNTISTLHHAISVKTGKRYQDKTQIKLLTHLKEPVLDLLNSPVTTHSEYLNKNLIQKNVESFYREPADLNTSITANWLTFALWTQKLNC